MHIIKHVKRKALNACTGFFFTSNENLRRWRFSLENVHNRRANNNNNKHSVDVERQRRLVGVGVHVCACMYRLVLASENDNEKNITSCMKLSVNFRIWVMAHIIIFTRIGRIFTHSTSRRIHRQPPLCFTGYSIFPVWLFLMRVDYLLFFS
jgi:hypothetical protein